MSIESKLALDLTNKIITDVLKVFDPPEEGVSSLGQLVVPNSVVRRTRGYIEKVANEINGCYENGWYDACAVMMRRLIETLIIHAFEHHQIDHKIKDKNGDFISLEGLITSTLNEPQWNLGRITKGALPDLKKLGDLSAHARRYNTYLKDIQPFTKDFRIVVEELLHIAGLK